MTHTLTGRHTQTDTDRHTQAHTHTHANLGRGGILTNFVNEDGAVVEHQKGKKV